jgi:hypothetical protein
MSARTTSNPKLYDDFDLHDQFIVKHADYTCAECYDDPDEHFTTNLVITGIFGESSTFPTLPWTSSPVAFPGERDHCQIGGGRSSANLSARPPLECTKAGNAARCFGKRRSQTPGSELIWN